MIKKLQRKFVLIAMLAIILVTGTIFGLITFESYRQTNRQTDELIGLIVENNGSFPDYKSKKDDVSEFITKETEFSTRYFTLRLDSSNEIIDMNLQYIAAVSQEDVNTILESVLASNENSGYYNNYKYRIVQNDGETLIVFLDCNLQISSFNATIRKSLIIIGIGYLVVFVIVSFFSKKALKPFVDNMNKQNQFITNASHELKTPLAVITADLDVLEMTVGEDNEWVDSIKNQTQRLNTLIKSLLSLANFEEGKNNLNIVEFSLTDVVKEELDVFKVLIQDRKIVFNEQADVKIAADINSIKQLITIFIDNAIKYTDNNGTIEILLEKQGKSTKMEFSNTCDNIDKVNTDKLFDRFYRGDKSRNKEKEGYGIGLSIAKSIVDMHKGKIKAFINDKNMICFRVII